MRGIGDTHIEVRPDILRWAHDAIAHPAALSVILFGSRALGTARGDSDWDTAVVVKDDDELPADIADACLRWSPHGAVLVNETAMRENAGTYASLPSEIAAGVVLAGRNYHVRVDDLRNKDTEQARNQYATMAVNMWTAIELEVRNLAMCHDSGLAEAAVDIGRHSANAAEYVAKLLCLSLGLPFSHTHQLDLLAEELPDEWREVIAALNGRTHDLHIAGYGGPPHEDIPRTFEETKNRLLGTLAVVERLATMRMVVAAKERATIQGHLAPGNPRKYLDMALADAKDGLPDLVDAVERTRAAWLDRIERDASG